MSTQPDTTPTDAPTDTPAEPTIENVDDLPDADGELRPPDLAGSWIPMSGWWRYRRWRKKQAKYAKKGYIQWKLLGSTDPRPSYIKPEAKGGGVPEYEHDGKTYLFPPEAAVPDARTGMWTFYHREGDAKPINPQTSVHPSIDPADLKEYLTKRPTASPPGWLDKFNMDPQNLLMYLVGGIILFAVIQRAMGGGF